MTAADTAPLFSSLSRSGNVTRGVSSDAAARLRQSHCIVLRGPLEVGKSSLASAVAAQVSARPATYYASRADHRDELLAPDGPLHRSAGRILIIEDFDTAPSILDNLRSVLDVSTDRFNIGYFVLVTSRYRRNGCLAKERLGTLVESIDLTPIALVEITDHTAAQASAASVLDDIEGEQPIRVVTSDTVLATHWLRGGFPISLVAVDDAESSRWRGRYIDALCERDYSFIEPSLMSSSVRLLLRRVALLHGSVLRNHVTKTERALLHYLVDLGVLRFLPPWFANNHLKRLEREPRVYIRDSGLLHALLDVRTRDQLAAAANGRALGFSWEGYCIEQLLVSTNAPAFFYRAGENEEIDLVLEMAADRRVAIEFKANKDQVAPGFHAAAAAIEPSERYVVTRAPESYDKGTYRVMTLPDMIRVLRSTAAR